MQRAVTSVVVVLFVGALSLVTVRTSAAAPATDTPTFTKDVAPILYEHCLVCHRGVHDLEVFIQVIGLKGANHFVLFSYPEMNRLVDGHALEQFTVGPEALFKFG